MSSCVSCRPDRSSGRSTRNCSGQISDNLYRCVHPEGSFMDLQMNGKTALVTGGSAGIGKAIAFALAREGVDVAICARRKEPLKAAASQMARKQTAKSSLSRLI